MYDVMHKSDRTLSHTIMILVVCNKGEGDVCCWLNPVCSAVSLPEALTFPC